MMHSTAVLFCLCRVQYCFNLYCTACTALNVSGSTLWKATLALSKTELCLWSALYYSNCTLHSVLRHTALALLLFNGLATNADKYLEHQTKYIEHRTKYWCMLWCTKAPKVQRCGALVMLSMTCIMHITVSTLCNSIISCNRRGRAQGYVRFEDDNKGSYNCYIWPAQSSKTEPGWHTPKTAYNSHCHFSK